MKTRNILINNLYIFAFAGALTLSSCGEKFDEYPWIHGTAEDQPDDDDDGRGRYEIDVMEAELKAAIPMMTDFGDHAYQYQRSILIDNYAGYWGNTQNNYTFGGALPTLYTFPNNYLEGAWFQKSIFTQSKNAALYADELEKPEWRAIAYIIQGFVGNSLIDIFGAIPHQDWRNNKRVPPLNYEKGYDVYLKIFNELEEALAILNERQPSATELSKIEWGESTLGLGDWRRWAKFANSIRLRMAMNIVKSHPGLAQQQAESAVNDPIGVFTDKDMYDFAYYFERSQAAHPNYKICIGWLDIRLGASLESILKRQENPLLGVWFNRNSNPINNSAGVFSGIGANQDFIGVRAGIAMINKSNEKTGYGPFSTCAQFQEKMPRCFLKRTEMLFAMSEGALRGWNMGGTAQEFYERGIRLAFAENGITDELMIQGYINNDKINDVDYVDPYNAVNSIKGRVNVCVKWNNEDSDELKLEKIITQRYVAIFPQGADAWVTFKRTGYPRLFPVKLNNMPGVDTELQIRRIPFIETANNKDEINNSMVPAMGGPNNGGTRLFWDVPTEQRGDIIEENSNSPVVIPVNF